MNFRRSIIIAELWRPGVSRRWIFFLFFCVFGKTTFTGKFSKFCSERNSPLYRSTCCVQISWNLADGNRQSRALFAWQKFSLPLCSYIAAWIATKICQGQRQTIGLLKVIRISFKSVHFRRSYIRTREHRQNAHESESRIRLKPIASSRIINGINFMVSLQP